VLGVWWVRGGEGVPQAGVVVVLVLVLLLLLLLLLVVLAWG
jgi:hypothetical protein